MRVLLCVLLLTGAAYGITNDPDYINWRGCANGDGSVDMSDPIYMSNFLYHGGPEPVCAEAADANSDGSLNGSDIVFLTNFLFGSGPQGNLLEEVGCFYP